MSKNDKYLLDQILTSRKADLAPDLPSDRFFEYYTADEILKHYGLSNDELDSGLVAGGNDGGIDGIFAFVNDDLLTPDFDFMGIRNEPMIRLVLIQAKQSSSYEETAINALISSAHDLLDLDAALPELAKRYNGQLMSAIADFHRAARELASKFPIFDFNYYYVTKGDSASVHPNVVARVDTLKAKLRDYFYDLRFEFKFLGARDLLNLARRQATSAAQLPLTEYIPAGQGGVIGLVRIRDYFRFITDSEGRRLHTIFDANVREYEGDVEVNKAIRDTLENGEHRINFWWLNNGITIIASKAPITGKSLTLENPKVVNGLQTSQEIYEYFASNQGDSDNREVLVRVIVTTDESTRNMVIKATNSQTKITPQILRATEQIHYDIEQDFLHHGLYYDRQRNFYKNQGKARAKIITIRYLAQAIAAMLLQEPNNSRGRPTNLLNDEVAYKRIFSNSYDISIYRKCALLMKAVDDYLRRDAPDEARKESTNLRWHLAMFLAGKLANTTRIDPALLSRCLTVDSVDNELMTASVAHVYSVFSDLRQVQNSEGDRIAKNKEFDRQVLARLEEVLANKRPFTTSL